jgi:signal transduction histidine kinase
VTRGILARLLLAAASAAVIVGALFAVLLGAIDSERDAARESRDAEATVATATELERLTVDLETAQRGFLVTGQEDFLAPGVAAQGRLPGVIDALRRGSPRNSGAIDAIAAGIEEYVEAWYDRAVALGRTDIGAARRLAATGEGKRRMDALRARFERLVAAEREHAAAARGRAERGAKRATAIGIAGGAAAIAFMFALAIYLARSIALPIRRVADASGQLARGDLSVRVPPRAERAAGEVGELARGFNLMASALEESRDELEAQNAELETQQETLAESATELEAQHDELEVAVAELAHEKHRLEILHRFGEAIVADAGFEARATRLLREICDAANAELGVVYGADPERPAVLRLTAVRGVEREALPAVLAADAGLPGRAVAERRTVEASHGDTGLRLRALGQDVAVQHELHVPLLQAGAAIAVVTLARTAAAPFSDSERDLVDRLAAQGSVALANALALSQVSRRESINAAVLDATPDAIGLFGADGTALLMNGPMRLLPGELGGPLAAMVAPDAAGDRPRDELAAGDRRFERFSTVVHDGASEAVGRLVMLRDVTAEREAERLKDEFFALVSHELRTPLTSILGYVDLLLEGEADRPEDPAATTRRHFLVIVERNSRRLLRLVGDLLFVAQIEAGRINLEHGELRLSDLARDAVEAARPRAEAAAIDLTIAGEATPPTAGDPDRIAQALDNLISNALKFTPSGGAVSVRTSVRGERAAVEVADTGPGIPPDEQEHLFERFFRTRGATDAAIPGVGLGLAIVKAIVEGHRGSVTVVSGVGEGTTFAIEIPLVSPVPTAAGRGTANEEAIDDT